MVRLFSFIIGLDLTRCNLILHFFIHYFRAGRQWLTLPETKARKFIKKYMPRFTEKVLNKGSKTVLVNSRFTKHLSNLGLVGKRYAQNLSNRRRNFAEYFMSMWGLAKLRLEFMGEPYLNTTRCMMITSSNLESLIKKEKLDQIV